MLGESTDKWDMGKGEEPTTIPIVAADDHHDHPTAAAPALVAECRQTPFTSMAVIVAAITRATTTHILITVAVVFIFATAPIVVFVA